MEVQSLQVRWTSKSKCRNHLMLSNPTGNSPGLQLVFSLLLQLWHYPSRSFHSSHAEYYCFLFVLLLLRFGGLRREITEKGLQFVNFCLLYLPPLNFSLSPSKRENSIELISKTTPFDPASAFNSVHVHPSQCLANNALTSARKYII